MKVHSFASISVAALMVVLPGTFVQGGSWTSREVPARSIPVPLTVSPEMRRIIAAPTPTNKSLPKTNEEWKSLRDTIAAARLRELPGLRERFGVTVENTKIAGVNCYVFAPRELPEQNRSRLLIHFHGGAYIFFPGESGTKEAILMAGFARMKVISVDYRMSPDFPYPAGLDDLLAVYKEAVKMAKPQNIAVFGTSAGGGMTLALMLRAKQDGLRLPAAMAPGTPAADLTKTSDSYFTNAMVDNSIVSYEPMLEATTRLYANGHDMKEPLLSPIYGDFRGLPPAIITSGTRDLQLSDAVRVHRKLRRAGVEAQLQVFEGQSHAQYMADPSAPETKEAFEEIASFFDRHLGK
jgi:epsilon-lactone hydrolase